MNCGGEMILKASTNCEESALVESGVCVPFRSLFFDLQLVLAVCPKNTRHIHTPKLQPCINVATTHVHTRKTPFCLQRWYIYTHKIKNSTHSELVYILYLTLSLGSMTFLFCRLLYLSLARLPSHYRHVHTHTHTIQYTVIIHSTAYSMR